MKPLALKLVVAAGLLGWLLHSGTIHMSAAGVLVSQPSLLAATLSALIFGVVLGAVRWRLLLRLAGVQLPLGYAIELQLIGLFFNIALPGGIGGDVAKAIYAAREAAPERRPAVYLIGFVDRLIGAGGLVLVAVCALALQGSSIGTVRELKILAIGVAIIAVLTLAAPAVVMLVLRRTAPRSAPSTSRIGRAIDQLLDAARLVSAAPGTLAIALALAVAMHIAGGAVFALLAHAISSHDAPAASVLAVYPLGMLTVMLPISYAGIGVGHLAFERLFALLGMSDGASVFNTYFIAQSVPCLLGVIPYLAVRRRQAPPNATEVALQ